MAAALKASAKPRLYKVEAQRLQVLATSARTHKDLLADYINYYQIEAKLVEIDEKIKSY